MIQLKLITAPLEALVRNAEAHNNGIHVDDDDDKVTWNEMTIIFKRGEQIDYGGHKHGILDVLKQVVVNSNKIIQEPDIVDTSYAWL